MTLIQTGSSIPDRHLCLTFDDGPGPYTADISSYLRSEGISATFFLIGKFVAAHRGTVQQLLDDGHEIGNHTHNHPHLTAPPYAVGSEILGAHSEIRTFVAHYEKPLFFRPPYGFWPTLPELNDVRTPQGERLGDLYAGPISWDFDGEDYKFWAAAASADDADALQRAKSNCLRARRGIVLLHDHCGDSHLIAAQTQTYRMIRLLVPQWKKRGYRFVSLRDAYRAGHLNVPM
ncbi:polysaccharide deacetylase family protein [Bradyrhizobium sp. URHA0013]|uniref:polysaccharide deacetylase family protein n=1 Tax=Bradyrhizobium sp. URHA0013 TaxID=1380352 RepID=UPI0009E025C3|nr:polysaccharide deacetylase family protein [Bradyrhizobium sp. URHA0013]